MSHVGPRSLRMGQDMATDTHGARQEEMPVAAVGSQRGKRWKQLEAAGTSRGKQRGRTTQHSLLVRHRCVPALLKMSLANNEPY